MAKYHIAHKIEGIQVFMQKPPIIVEQKSLTKYIGCQNLCFKLLKVPDFVCLFLYTDIQFLCFQRLFISIVENSWVSVALQDINNNFFIDP